MSDLNTDLIQGTLDLLVLKTVALAPLHSYGIARRIEDVSQGVFKANPGSLLTALKRLQRAGWLDASWGETDNARRARFYRLTPEGRRQLELELDLWRRRSTAMDRLLAAPA